MLLTLRMAGEFCHYKLARRGRVEWSQLQLINLVFFNYFSPKKELSTANNYRQETNMEQAQNVYSTCFTKTEKLSTEQDNCFDFESVGSARIKSSFGFTL